ncbi:hypothetical protein [Microvirga vignae]|uniref:hypothetical protein n=1 Tax=Microvirga vignae TaxID=1225564 RepID=UPI0006998BDD|nr:hypothetical protein [Microvirga vignae]
MTVSSAAQQTSANVQTVAAATEELSISIREIARNVQEAARGTDAVTGSIGDVQQGAGQELARHSNELGREVATFLQGVKAA